MVWGLKRRRSNRWIYYASGQVEHSRAYEYRISCRTISGSDCLSSYGRLNLYAHEAIQRFESRERYKDTATRLFDNYPDFEISLVTYPTVGDKQVLFERGVQLATQNYNSRAIARYCCTFMGYILETLDLTHLVCARKEGEFTALFWHSVVLRAYVEFTS